MDGYIIYYMNHLKIFGEKKFTTFLAYLLIKNNNSKQNNMYNTLDT